MKKIISITLLLLAIGANAAASDVITMRVKARKGKSPIARCPQSLCISMDLCKVVGSFRNLA